MKKYSRLLCAILTVCMILTVMPFGVFADEEKEVSFKDVEGHWAEEYIAYWANTMSEDGKQYVIGGYPDGSFMPDACITRGAAAAILDRACDFPTLGNAKAFPDVPEDNVFFEHIMACADNNIIKGYEDGCFRPEAGITRQAAVALIARCLMSADDYKEYSDDAECKSILSEKFNDASSISESFYAELCFMVEQGILEGFADGTVRPTQLVTRAQFVKLLYVLHEDNVANEEEDLSDKTFKVSLTITDGKKSVSGSVDKLDCDASVVDAIMSIVDDKHDDIEESFKSEAVKKSLGGVTAVYSLCSDAKWDDEAKSDWEKYINYSYGKAAGDKALISAFADADSTFCDIKSGTYTVNMDGITIVIVITAY